MPLKSTTLVTPVVCVFWCLLISNALCNAGSGAVAAGVPQRFNITAIAAADGKSTLECWQLTDPILISATVGTAGTATQRLGDVANASYTVLPPHFDGGKHTAPSAQYVGAFVLFRTRDAH